jgi:PBSX family phage terminase large subunit
MTINLPRTAFLPAYRHLHNSPFDIDLLWGGRDSGKSRFVASRLLVDCLRADYFRCGLFRKVYNTIRESQWQTLKDVAEYWKIDHLFDFNTSPLEVRCKLNNNKFIARGFDEPGKIKSLSNINYAWVEEGNQLEMDDFIVLMTTLRTNIGHVKVWVTFNPEADGPYEQFWMYKTFFAKYTGDIYSNFHYTWDIPVGTGTVSFSYQSTHTTYQDNRYVTDIRQAFLEYLGELDPYYYQVFTLGKWGNRRVGDPFCFAFEPLKHRQPCVARRNIELVLSFDFNVNPITCGVYQSWFENGRTRVICPKAFKLPNSDIYKLCAEIRAQYPNHLYRVTGDATGKNTSAMVQDGINYYTVIKKELNLAEGQLSVPRVNPIVKENRVLVNAAFKLLDVAFDPEGAKDLIFDCQYVSVNEMGDIDKGDRSNPKKRADHLDHWRYYLNTFHRHILRLT